MDSTIVADRAGSLGLLCISALLKPKSARMTASLVPQQQMERLADSCQPIVNNLHSLR